MIRRVLLVMLALFLSGAALDAFGAEACRASDNCDEGEAYSAAMEYASRTAAGREGEVACVVRTGGAFVGGIVSSGYQCISSYQRLVETFSFNNLCLSRSEETGWTGPKFVCHRGCKYEVQDDPDIGTYYSTLNDAAGTGHGVCTNGDTPAPGTGGDDGGGTGSETGEGGDNGGGNDGDGGGSGESGGGTGSETGGGNGGGTGTGNENGNGEGNGNGNGSGTTPGDGSGGGAGPGTGRLYKKSGKSLEKLIDAHMTKVQGAPIVSKVKGIFGNCTGGGGSCPSYTWDGGSWAGKHDLSTLCSGVLLELIGFAGWALFAGLTVVAVRWALL